MKVSSTQQIPSELVGVNLDLPSERNQLIYMTLLEESYNFVPENLGVKL
jgi:hypothetical protein